MEIPKGPGITALVSEIDGLRSPIVVGILEIGELRRLCPVRTWGEMGAPGCVVMQLKPGKQYRLSRECLEQLG